MSEEQMDDVPAGVDEIVETLLDGGASYFSDEEGHSMDDLLDTVDLPPFDDGSPVGATMERRRLPAMRPVTLGAGSGRCPHGGTRSASDAAYLRASPARHSGDQEVRG